MREQSEGGRWNREIRGEENSRSIRRMLKSDRKSATYRTEKGGGGRDGRCVIRCATVCEIAMVNTPINEPRSNDPGLDVYYEEKATEQPHKFQPSYIVC